MQIHLVIPGLIWPGASAVSPVAGLELPALSQLLGAGTRQLQAFRPLDQELARVFGLPLPDQAAGALPLAALRRLGEAAGPADATGAHWLCADPVHLSFAREHLLLTDLEGDELASGEIAALLDTLNTQFSDLGQFEAAAPTRWYLRLTTPSPAHFYPLHDVIGRPIKDFLPEGDDARRWQRALNEIQVVLHNHPVNQAREADGRRSVNSLWFWGAGSLPATPPRPAAAVQTRDLIAAGFARAAGIEPSPPDLTGALRQDTLVFLDSLLKPAMQLDIDRWRDALATLERDWFAPLRAAQRAGRIDRFTLTAPGDRGTLSLTIDRADRWKFWRRPQPFAQVLDAFAPAPHAPRSPDRQP